MAIFEKKTAFLDRGVKWTGTVWSRLWLEQYKQLDSPWYGE